MGGESTTRTFSSYVSPHHRHGGLSTLLHQEADLRLISPSVQGASRGQVENRTDGLCSRQVPRLTGKYS